jgi:hypothetical protein
MCVAFIFVGFVFGCCVLKKNKKKQTLTHSHHPAQQLNPPFFFFSCRGPILSRGPLATNRPTYLSLSLTLSLTGGAHPSGSPLTSSQLPSLPVPRRPHCPAPPARLPASLPLLLQCVATHSVVSQPSPPRNHRAPSTTAINGRLPTDPAPPPWPCPFPLRPIKGQQDLLSTASSARKSQHRRLSPMPEHRWPRECSRCRRPSASGTEPEATSKSGHSGSSPSLVSTHLRSPRSPLSILLTPEFLSR